MAQYPKYRVIQVPQRSAIDVLKHPPVFVDRTVKKDEMTDKELTIDGWKWTPTPREEWRHVDKDSLVVCSARVVDEEVLEVTQLEHQMDNKGDITSQRTVVDVPLGVVKQLVKNHSDPMYLKTVKKVEEAIKQLTGNDNGKSLSPNGLGMLQAYHVVRRLLSGQDSVNEE